MGIVRLCIALVAGFATFVVLSGSASAQGFTVSFGSFDFEASPGDKLTGSIHVSNQVDESLAVRVYLGDIVRNPAGSDEYQFVEELGQEARSLASWMHISPDQFDLAAHTESDVNFEVNVPSDPALSGSYWAVVFVEREPTQEELLQQVQSDPAKKETRIGIRTIWRYATRIGVTIKGTKSQALSAFKSVNVQPAGDKYMVNAVFENSANFYFQPKVWLEAQDESGKTVTKIDHAMTTVLPESRHAFNFELEQVMLPPGTYLLTVIADYGGPSLIGARAKVNVEPPAAGAAKAADPAATTPPEG